MRVFTAAATAILASAASSADCLITAYGAVSGDGVADTAAIAAALDDCRARGGRAVVPAGAWEIEQLALETGAHLHLAAGAVVSLVADIDAFPEQPFVRLDGDENARRPAIFAHNADHVAITGPGRIDGRGERFWDANFYQTDLRRPTLPRPGPLIEISGGVGARLEGITITDTPHYVISLTEADGARIRDVVIRNDLRSPNTDGIQLRDTSNVVIDGVDIVTGDDAIVLKSHKRVIENVIVTNSTLVSDDSALKFGTGSAVGVQNSVFSDLIIRDSRYGIALFMLDGGRHADNLFSNIRIETGGRYPRQYAIYADIDRRRPDSELGQVVRQTFAGIEVSSGGNILIAGHPDAAMEDIALRDVRVHVPAAPFDLTTSGRKPRGNTTLDLDQRSVDYSGTDAHFVFAHIRNLSLDGVEVSGPGAAARETSAVIDVTPPSP